MNPLVSIVILNYNQLEVTVEFLESCKVLSYDNYEIILVDNNSNESPFDYVRTNFPEVIMVMNDKNLGFTGGNNSGIKVSNGDYIFIVNNDTEVTENLLEELLKPFNIDDTIGIVCPKIKFFSNPNLIQYAGYNPINPYTGRNSAIGNLQVDKGQFDDGYYTNYAHGAAMMVKREVFEKVGLFPDHFFIYYEELDFSVRARKAGYKIFYQGKCEIYHKESITVGKESVLKAYYQNRNRIMYMRRNCKKHQFFIFMLFFMILSFPKGIGKYLIQRKFKHLYHFLKGVFWNIRISKEKVLLNNYLY